MTSAAPSGPPRTTPTAIPRRTARAALATRRAAPAFRWARDRGRSRQAYLFACEELRKNQQNLHALSLIQFLQDGHRRDEHLLRELTHQPLLLLRLLTREPRDAREHPDPFELIGLLLVV